MNLDTSKLVIMNNLTKHKSEDLAKQFSHTYGMTFKALNSTKYQYIHSLQGERNSGILDSNWPQNYVNDILLENMKREYDAIIIDTKDLAVIKIIEERTGIGTIALTHT